MIHHPVYPMEFMCLQQEPIVELLELSTKLSAMPDTSQLIGHKSRIRIQFLYLLLALKNGVHKYDH